MLPILRISGLFLLFAFLTTQSFAEHTSYQTTSDAGVTYELIIETEIPEVMKPLPVRLNIKDKKGEQITGAQIDCSLTMPAMAMPNNKPPIKESDQPGQYRGMFLLTMGGLWHVELAMSCCDGKTSLLLYLFLESCQTQRGMISTKSLRTYFTKRKAKTPLAENRQGYQFSCPSHPRLGLFHFLKKPPLNFHLRTVPTHGTFTKPLTVSI